MVAWLLGCLVAGLLGCWIAWIPTQTGTRSKQHKQGHAQNQANKDIHKTAQTGTRAKSYKQRHTQNPFAQKAEAAAAVGRLWERYGQHWADLETWAPVWVPVAVLFGLWLRGGTQPPPPAPRPRYEAPPLPQPILRLARRSPPEEDELVQGFLSEQRSLQRTVAALQAELAEVRSQKAGSHDTEPTTVVPGPSTLERMTERLDQMEKLLALDSRAPRPALGAEEEHGASRAVGVAAPGNDVSVGSSPEKTEELIAELERAAVPMHQAFFHQLRRYREVSPWPLPAGYRTRLAPGYLAQVYKNGVSGV